MSSIPSTTLSAYQETDYCVFHESPFVLRIGIASESLLALYRQFKTDCAAFITACNPHSQPLEDAANENRQMKLAQELNKRGLKYLNGEGKHPNGNWPAEKSFLVLGIALEQAQALGQQFEQNAVVWCGADAVPAVVLLR